MEVVEPTPMGTGELIELALGTDIRQINTWKKEEATHTHTRNVITKAESVWEVSVKVMKKLSVGTGARAVNPASNKLVVPFHRHCTGPCTHGLLVSQ